MEHVSVRHSKCPLNKKNLAEKTQAEKDALHLAATRKCVENDRRLKAAEAASKRRAAENEARRQIEADATEDSPNTVMFSDVGEIDLETDDEDTQPEPEEPAAEQNPEPEESAAEQNPEPEEPDTTVTHQMGANVLAKWKRNSWFLSHVCGVTGRGRHAVYDVYCPVERKVKKRLTATNVKPCNLPNVLSRGDLVKMNATFFFDGDDDISPSTWKVRAVNHTKNEFVCVRISPDNARGPNIDNFQVGYVFERVQEEMEEQRERGPSY